MMQTGWTPEFTQLWHEESNETPIVCISFFFLNKGAEEEEVHFTKLFPLALFRLCHKICTHIQPTIKSKNISQNTVFCPHPSLINQALSEV